MKKIYIDYYSEGEKLWIDHRQSIYDMIRFLRSYYSLKQMVFILLTDSLGMITLNKHYRNLEKDTNVISLEMTDDELCLGEVILSYEKIQNEFHEKKMPNETFIDVYSTIYSSFELYLFFIISHGFLHLLGYDHQNLEEEKKMNDEQAKLIACYMKHISKDSATL